jgi:hypothetical protein
VLSAAKIKWHKKEDEELVICFRADGRLFCFAKR